MNEAQDYSSSKSPWMVAGWVLCAIMLVWAIVATSLASKRNSELIKATDDYTKLKSDYDYQTVELQKSKSDLEQERQKAAEMRKIAQEYTIRAQQVIQDYEKKKVEAAKKTSTSTSTSKSKSSTPAKKTSSTKTSSKKT